MMVGIHFGGAWDTWAAWRRFWDAYEPGPYDEDVERRQDSACYGPCPCCCTLCDWIMPEAPSSCVACGSIYCADCIEDDGCIATGCRTRTEER